MKRVLIFLFAIIFAVCNAGVVSFAEENASNKNSVTNKVSSIEVSNSCPMITEGTEVEITVKSSKTISVEIENKEVVAATLSNGVLKITGLKIGESAIWLRNSGTCATVDVIVCYDEVKNASEWARADVRKAIGDGFVPSELYEEWTRSITREEFAKVAVRFLELEPVISVSIKPAPFTDTENSYVLAAYEAGIVKGDGERKFNPTGKITRQEAAVMLMRVAKYMGAEISSYEPEFKDNDAIASWAKDAVGWAQETGVMQGDEKGNFNPYDEYSVEQAIVTFLRLQDTDQRETLSLLLEEGGADWSIKYSYDDKGNQTRMEDSDGNWATYEYDENGKEVYGENSDGYWEKSEYDDIGNITYYGDSYGEWEKYAYDELGNVTYFETSGGYWEKNEYDESGNMTYASDSTGSWVEFKYDKKGNKTYEKTSWGYEVNNKYDENNRLIFADMISYNAWIKYEYDESGNLIYTESSKGTWEEWEYDEQGNKVFYNSNYGNWEKWQYDESGNNAYYENADGITRKYEYDENGNMTYAEWSNGYWIKREYDSYGNETYYEQSDGYWEKNVYDKDGNKTYYENSEENWEKYIVVKVEKG